MRRWLSELSIPSGFAALIILAGAVGYYMIKGDFDTVMRVLTALGVFLLAFFLYGSATALRGNVGTRQLRYGSNTLVMIAAFMGILVLANVFVARNTQRWDLTESQDFSLSDQSLKVLASVKEPIRVIGFFSDQDYSKQQVQDLLKEYSAKSDKIVVEFIDPDVKPAEAERYLMKDYGTLAFISGSRRQDITGVGESDMTSAILKLTSGEQRRIGFLVGHGERAIDGSDRSGYSQLKQLLEGDNYRVETINLTTSPTLTTDVAVLVVASPQASLLSHEKDAIKKYLDEGGRMVLLVDPFVTADLNELVEKWGVELGKGAAIDQSMSFLGDPGTVVVQQYRWSPMTKDLRAMTVLPLATNVKTKTPAPENVTYTTLFEISERGWVQMDQRVVKFDESTDTKGPVPLALAVEEQKTVEGEETKSMPRMVVVGDSDFASNGFIGTGANLDLIVNSVNWLAQSEQLISIRPKPPADRTLVLTGGQGNFILFSSAILLPGIVLLAGAATWWRRR